MCFLSGSARDPRRLSLVLRSRASEGHRLVTATPVPLFPTSHTVAHKCCGLSAPGFSFPWLPCHLSSFPSCAVNHSKEVSPQRQQQQTSQQIHLCISHAARQGYYRSLGQVAKCWWVEQCSQTGSPKSGSAPKEPFAGKGRWRASLHSEHLRVGGCGRD